MKNLPLELKQEITLYIGFIKTLCLFPNIAHYIYDPKKYTWSWSAETGHLEIIKWLHHNRTEGCTTWAIDWAASNGHLEIIKFLHKNRTEGCTKLAMDWAAKYGHIKIVKWLHLNRTEGCTTDAMDWSARNGHLEIVKFLHLNRIEGLQIRTWMVLRLMDT